MLLKKTSFSKLEHPVHEEFKTNMPDLDELTNWYEIRPAGQQPERRGFHTCFVFDNKMFMFGGRDTSEGFFNKIWHFNLDFLAANEIEESVVVPQWTMTELQVKNQLMPPPLSHHSAVVYQNFAFVFGGNLMSGQINNELYKFDCQLFRWDKITQIGEKPGGIDDHTCNIYKDSMVVFAGFRDGVRSNDLFKFNFKMNAWSAIIPKEGLKPEPRAGHVSVIFQNNLAIFGGTNEKNERLNDTWLFNFYSREWTCINQSQPSKNLPLARSGASAVLYAEKFLILSGGIHLITKELDDLWALNLETQTWTQLQRSSLSKITRIPSPFKQLDTRMSSKNLMAMSNPDPSPYHNLPSATKLTNRLSQKSRSSRSVSKNFTQRSKSFRGQQTQPQTKRERVELPHVEITFTSPTSLRMKDTFIIKSESYIKLSLNSSSPLKKLSTRKLSDTKKTDISDDGLDAVQEQAITDKVPNKRIVQYKRPAPRDGHSCLMAPGADPKFMVVFGGDRHGMPFNDLFMLDLSSEITSKVKD